MARTKRIDLPYMLYHVFSRANSGDVGFIDSRDKAKFLEYLAKYVETFEFRVHAWCLMSNHFHLLLESVKHPFLSEFMRRLLTAYTVFFNRRHERHGHLFQGRFKSLVVDKSDYLLALSRYIHLNPVLAGIADDPEANRDSSLHFYLYGGEPNYLYTKEILSFFGGDRHLYGQFIREGMNEDIKPQIIQRQFIGGDQFVQRMNSRLKRLSQNGTFSHATAKSEIRDRMAAESARAEEILNHVADYFGYSAQEIRQGRGMRNHLFRARAVCAALLRKKLPWTGRNINEFLFVKTGFYRFLNKIKNDKAAQTALDSIHKNLE
ncbi:transposase [Candidatus Sumerlaeota bacterium]|nr:transposase [Candidatus Sumerlaeota bacterium]